MFKTLKQQNSWKQKKIQKQGVHKNIKWENKWNKYDRNYEAKLII